MTSLIAKARANRESGFTLIELLVVIVIIGILAAIAIPVFTSQRAKAQDAKSVSEQRSVITALETFAAGSSTGSVSALPGTAVEFAGTLKENGATNTAGDSIVTTVTFSGTGYTVSTVNTLGTTNKPVPVTRGSSYTVPSTVGPVTLN